MPLVFSSNRAPAVIAPPSEFDPNNPFIADSAHHRPIGSGAAFAGDSHVATVTWANTPTVWGDYNQGSPYGIVWHIVNGATSPRVTINANPDLEDALRNIPAFDIPFPASVTFNPGTAKNDSTVAFIEEDTGKVHEFRECRAQSGLVATPSAPMLAGSYRPHYAKATPPNNSQLLWGMGHGIAIGESNRVGHLAAGMSAIFGLLVPDDVRRSGPIGHALQTVLPSHNTTSYPAPYPPLLSTVIQLPAVTRDRSASSPPAGWYTGPFPYGGILSLNHGFDIYSRGYSGAGLKVAEAIWQYGIVIVDTGGNFAIRTAQGFTSAEMSSMRAALRDLKPFLRLILNGAWDPTDRRKPTGGGVARAPNTGIDA